MAHQPTDQWRNSQYIAHQHANGNGNGAAIATSHMANVAPANQRPMAHWPITQWRGCVGLGLVDFHFQIDKTIYAHASMWICSRAHAALARYVA
jgi:hypothetical protein